MIALFVAKRPILSNTPFQIGAPVKKGAFFAANELTLCTSEQDLVPCSIKIVSLWPDQSIKWLNIMGEFLSDYASNTQFHLKINKKIEPVKRHDWVVCRNDELHVDTIQGLFRLNYKQFAKIQIGNQQVTTELECKINSLTTSVGNVETDYEILFDQTNKPLLCKVIQKAVAIDASKTRLNLSLSLNIYFADGQVHARLDMHNPAAIEHDGGQWDLGNEKSLTIDVSALKFSFQSRQNLLVLKENEGYTPFDKLTLNQLSSGGENWNSENHKTSQNRVELTHKGALVEYTHIDTKKEFSIARPQPRLLIVLEDKKFHLIPHHFWEKYPTSLECNDSHARISFTNASDTTKVELQAGEIKSHTLVFGLNSEDKIPSWGATPELALSKENLVVSQIFAISNELFASHPLLPVLSCNNSFSNAWIRKREMVDEYGWRNFGDLYADHEAAEFKGSGIFVSHYNNQYDPLLGFLRQWFITNSYDTVNIDIYHTEDDKPEYNHGLFWHTDHYVAAETATHRTYSKHQATKVYIDHAGGGGPGAHHCYSSGLALYYLMSKDQRALAAVLGLYEWMTKIYEGDGTILNSILRIKNAEHLTLPFTQKLLLGGGHRTVRNVFTNKYPLDRGTGNYVNCLLDCFEITSNRNYLEQAEFVIINTITLYDDFSKLNFEDVENTWFYTVFLQSVVKYLGIMYQVKEDAPKSQYIRASFLHYANYIAEHEQPYLFKPGILEYPNDTWTGQDLRKIQILHYAYIINHNDKMLNKAQQLEDYIYPKLLKSKESSFTRIQALIMQNISDIESANSLFNGYKEWLDEIPKANIKRVHDGLYKNNYLKRIIKFINNYSIMNECKLLFVRVPMLRRLFNK